MSKGYAGRFEALSRSSAYAAERYIQFEWQDLPADQDKLSQAQKNSATAENSPG